MSKQTVIAYLRMSDDDQTNSIERQRSTYQTFLKNNSDKYESLGEFTEEGKSGDACVTRPIQQRLLQQIENKELTIDNLWVSEASRWGRWDTSYKMKFVLPLKRAGIKLLTNSQTIDFQKPESDLLYDVSQSMSYIENHQRAERVTSGIAVLISKKELPLPPCYGLRRAESGNNLEKDPHQCRIVELIYKKYLQTESYNATVSYLNNDLKEPSPAGKKWSLQTVREILRNPKLSGHYTYGRRQTGKIFTLEVGSVLPTKRKEDEKGQVIHRPDYVMEYTPEIIEPIIDLETWGKVQLIAVKNTRPRRIAKQSRSKYTGTIICRCGKRMRGRRRNPEVEYACQIGAAGGCTGIAHYEKKLDIWMLPAIKSLTDEKSVYENLYRQNAPSEQLDAKLETLREKFRVGQNRLADLDGLLPDGFTENLREIKREIDVLTAKQHRTIDVDKLREIAAQTARTYKEILSNKSDDEILTKDFVRNYLKEIRLELTRVKSTNKTKNFTAINRLFISVYRGYDNAPVNTVRRVSPQSDIDTILLTVDVQLPPHFYRCEPHPFDD